VPCRFGFKVESSEFEVTVLKCKVWRWKIQFRIEGEFRVYIYRFLVECRIEVSKFTVYSSRFRFQGAGYRVQNSG
jgi:hypothetical protein